MSYRISYLVPKKEFEHLLLGKKQSRAVKEAPTKNLPLLAGRRNPRKHHPTQKARKIEDNKKVGKEQKSQIP